MRLLLSLLVSFFLIVPCLSQSSQAPNGLMTDLIEHADLVYSKGYLTNLTLEEYKKSSAVYQVAKIVKQKPLLGWVVNDPRINVRQTAFQVLVASDKEKLQADIADLWDSKKVKSDNSVAVKYAGVPLEPNKVYYWKVRTWNNGTVSPWSPIAGFVTDLNLNDYAVSRYPVQKTEEYPALIERVSPQLRFVDFGKAAFGQLRLTLTCPSDTVIDIHMGEVARNNRVDRNPGGMRRYRRMSLSVFKGTHTYEVSISPDARNTGSSAVKMPAYIGEVMPFRYCEIDGYDGPLQATDVVRESAHYYFNDQASDFSCSNKVLNDVWNLCKYSIKATSFTGVYIDGDRERIPYEADALINQLCHYSVDREFSMARFSHQYLIRNPTWPTEWILQSVLMAWNDYLYTGNMESIRTFYEDIKAKTLLPLADETGLISSKTGKQTVGLLKAIHFSGTAIRDIVDWPQSGILGVGKNEPGETDGFVFKEVNTVVNAYHYRALVLMSRIAGALGNTRDAETLSLQALKVKNSFNRLLFDKIRGVYIDGVGTDHSSLHSNAFALAFGLVPETDRERVAGFIRSRGMACSVYGAQFLIEALYEAGMDDYALELLASVSDRSWANMNYGEGSTITLEAWGNKYKPNQDWNHAWGAAPANLIPRKLMGIEPLEPGFSKISISPRPGSLDSAAVVLPTIRGNILESFVNQRGKLFELNLSIPANTSAIVYIPMSVPGALLTLDGAPVKSRFEKGFLMVENVGSGIHRFRLAANK